MKRSRITSLRNFRRTEKFLTTAALAAAAASTVGFTHSALGATKTWTGAIADPNSPTYQVSPAGATAGFAGGMNIYQWNGSIQNWASGGAATTYAAGTTSVAGDSVVFTDNFNGGTLIDCTTSNLNPTSMTFSHIAGSTPTNYTFLLDNDFETASGGTINSATPFGTFTPATTLLLDTGFLGKVIFRAQTTSGDVNGNTIIKSGILEMQEIDSVPGTVSRQNMNLTLAGGELDINIISPRSGNITPGGSDNAGTYTVTANSVLAVTRDQGASVNGGAVPTSSRSLNGILNVQSGVTLTLKAPNNVRMQLGANLNGTGSLTSTGTFLLADGTNGTPTIVQLEQANAAPNATFDLGVGSSILQSNLNTCTLGALTGGVDTTLRANGSGSTVYAIGSSTINTNSTFNGTIADSVAGTFVNANSTALTKVGSSIFTLAGSNGYTGPTNVNAGTLVIGGANGSVLSSPVAANGGTLKIDNSTANNSNRLSDTLPVSLNQGTLEFVGNLTSQTNETAGTLTIAGADTVKTTDSAPSGSNSATITFAGLSRNNGIVNFDLATGTHVHFNNLANNGGIIGGFATVNNFQDWAALDVNNNVGTFANYNTNTDTSTWTAPNDNVKVIANSITLPGSTTVNSLNLAATSGAVSLVIPASNSLTVKGGGILTNSDATISGAGTLTAGDGTGPVELDILAASGKTITVNSVIANNGASGVVSLMKAGPGTLVLGASNTFSGALILAGGALSVGQDGLLSPNGGLTVDLGTTFDVGGFNQSVASISLINGTIKNTPTGIHGNAATLSVSGLINVQSGTISANLTGAAGLTKTGGGTVTLTGSNSYTGGTTVSNGNLNVNSTSAIVGNATFTGGTTNINSNTTLGTVVGSTGGSGATIAGAAGVVLTASSYEFIAGSTVVTAVLAGANPNVGVLKDADSNGSVSLNAANTFTGPVTIQNVGTVSTNNIKNGGVASGLGASSNAASNLVLDGGYLVYNGGATSTDRLFTITGNNGTILANTSSNGALVFSNPGAIVGSGILTLRGSSTGANTVSESFTSGITVAKNDGGQWVLGQASTFSEVRPNNGTLTMNVNENVNVASFQGGQLSGTGILTVNNFFDAANGVDNVAVIGSGTFQKDTGAFTINSTNSFTGGVTIGGTGLLNVAVLANGGTVSSIGQSSNADTNLVFNSTGTLSYIGAVATSTDRQFQLNANNAGFAANGVGSLATLTVANTFVLNDHSNTLNLGGANTGSNTFNPTIYGNGGLNKVDGGLWVLGSTANLFTGSVNLGVGAGGAGTLAISSIADGGIQGPNINVTQGSNIATIDSTTGLVVGMTISASDQIAPGTTILAIGNGTITLSQPSPGNGGTSPNFGFANALGISTGDSGNLNFAGGTLRYLGPTASTNRQLTIGTLGGGIDSSGTGPLSFTNTASVNGVSPARTFTFSGTNTGSNTFAGQLADNGGSLAITKSGKGMWTRTGNNSYTGVTTVTSGTLSLAGAGAWAPALTGTAGTALTGGRLVFDYSAAPASNPVNTIKTILTTGAAGSFTTGQIRTTNAGDLKHGIGFIDNGSNVTVGYTYYGDANVDGQVTTADFVALSSHFNATTGVTWANGDFNYDGKINALDFNLLATNFGAAAIAAPLPDAPALLGSLVPEPTSLALLGGIAAMGLRRRRRAAR